MQSTPCPNAQPHASLWFCGILEHSVRDCWSQEAYLQLTSELGKTKNKTKQKIPTQQTHSTQTQPQKTVMLWKIQCLKLFKTGKKVSSEVKQ